MSNVNKVSLVTIIPRRGEEAPTWTYKSDHGREFLVERIETPEGKGYFLAEAVPSGYYFETEGMQIDGPEVRVIKAAMNNNTPNTFIESLPEHIDPELLDRNHPGPEPGSAYYPSLESVKKAIGETLDADEWYIASVREGERCLPETTVAPDFERQEALKFWQEQLEMLTDASPGTPDRFKGLGNLFGSLSKPVRDAFLSYFNAPDAETWAALSRCILLGGGRVSTAWQVWMDNDPDAPISLGEDGWQTWPAPEDFERYLDNTRQKAIARCEYKIRQLQEEPENECSGPTLSLV